MHERVCGRTYTAELQEERQELPDERQQGLQLREELQLLRLLATRGRASPRRLPRKNGEVKYWIDGKVMADFPDLNLRSIDSLKIDVAKIGLQAGHSERVNKKWYDNVAVAKKYIGPITPLRP